MAASLCSGGAVIPFVGGWWTWLETLRSVVFFTVIVSLLIWAVIHEDDGGNRPKFGG